MRALYILALAMSCAACSIHPLPQDVTGNDTYRIVQKIRCETRDAVKSYVIGVLVKIDPELAAGVRDGSVTLVELNRFRKRLPPDAQAVFDKYDQAAIAYDFTFDITEKNDFGVTGDLVKPSGRGPFTAGLLGSSALQRQNIRNFRVSDTFEELVTKVTNEYCVEPTTGSNFIYPITGKIGVSELVGAFLDLNQSGGLTGGKDAPKVPIIADTIVFTTTFMVSTTPKIVISPIGHGLQLADAGINADASRADVHKVIIAISLPEDQHKPLKMKSAAAARAAATSSANKAIEYQVYRNLLNGKVLTVSP